MKSSLEVNNVKLLNVTIQKLNIFLLNKVIDENIKNGEFCIIANHNLHSIYLYQKDPTMQKFYNRAAYIHIDGMLIVLLGKLLGLPLKKEHRVTYVDWIRPLMAEASKNNWRIFYLGSKPGVANKGAEVLCKEFPNLNIKTQHGYFNMDKKSEENLEIIEQINEFKPNILFVGMGMPRQEHWILENYERLKVNVILPSGACIDYVAGVVPTPPRWMGRIGLEWLYRLLSEPKRLWKRYFIEPWSLIPLFIRDAKNYYIKM